MIVAFLLACGSVDPCAAQPEPAAEDCRLAALEPLWQKGDVAGFEAGLATLHDPTSRDLVRIRLAVADPARAGSLCAEVETDEAKERCHQVLGRPHLRAR